MTISAEVEHAVWCCLDSNVTWLDASDQTFNSFSVVGDDVINDVITTSLREVLGPRVAFGLAIPRQQLEDGQHLIAYVSVWKSGTLFEIDLTAQTGHSVTSNLTTDVLFSIAHEDMTASGKYKHNPGAFVYWLAGQSPDSAMQFSLPWAVFIKRDQAISLSD